MGEKKAAQYLLDRGYLLKDKNWRCRYGEIDLVFSLGKQLVFVEVKTRLATPGAWRYLFENIDSRKRKKLQALVGIYLKYHYRGMAYPPHRIDVVGVLLAPGNFSVVSVEHLVNAI